MASHKSSNSTLSAHGLLFWFLRTFHLPSQCDTSPSLLTAALEKACLHSIPLMLCQNLFQPFSRIHSQTISTIVHTHRGSRTTGLLILVLVCRFRCIFSSLTSFNAGVHNQDLSSCCSLSQHSDLLTRALNIPFLMDSLTTCLRFLWRWEPKTSPRVTLSTLNTHLVFPTSVQQLLLSCNLRQHQGGFSCPYEFRIRG